MIKVDPATGNIVDTDDTATFRSYLESVFETTDLERIYKKMSGKILESFATYLKNGSGWILKKVVRVEITNLSAPTAPRFVVFGITKKYNEKTGDYQHEER